MLVTTTVTGSSTVTATGATGSSMVTTAATTQQTSSQCYDCSGPDCGKEGSSVSTSCPSCMAYRNSNDQSKRLAKFQEYISIDNINSQNRTTLLLVGLWCT
jgi:hypothetical protein